MRDTIAVCMARANEEFQKDSLCAIFEQAKKYGLYVQVFNTFEELVFHNSNDCGEKSIFDRIDYGRLCGMILFSEKIKDNTLCVKLIENCKEQEIPVVAVDRKMEDCYSITFNYANAFEEIVRHLIEVHHCKSFYVMGGFRNNEFSDERINVVRKVTAEYGLELKTEDIGYGDFWNRPCMEEMKRFFASGRPLPDAFISVNDTMALAICDMLREEGYRVPKDTIVTGFDGIEEERYNTPRLTTSRQDIEAGGKRAVDIIYKVMNGEAVEREHVISFSVCFSQSCGCTPIGESDASEKVRDLYNQLKIYKQFSKYMYDMMDDVAGTRSIEGVLDRLPYYLKYMESFQHLYFCVESSCLDAYEDLIQKIIKYNRNLSGREDMDMILLGEWHADKGFEMPLLNFDRRELIPKERRCEVTDYLMFVPLHEQETVFGYLAVDFTPKENDYTQLRNLSINISHILDSVISHQKMKNFNEELKAANDKLEELYLRDPLTGIYNRRGFYQEISRCIRKHGQGRMMVVSADLNGLKAINDNYGHGEGDYAIKTVGRVLDKGVSERGICARFGGDEYAMVIFCDGQGNEEQEFRDNLLKQLEEINETSGKPYKLTCSCGIEMADVSADTDIEELLKKADEKMYHDKRLFYERTGMDRRR